MRCLHRALVSVPIKTELKRFNLIPEIEMFPHSTPIIPRGSFQVACEKIGDYLRSGIISGRV